MEDWMDFKKRDKKSIPVQKLQDGLASKISKLKYEFCAQNFKF